MPKGSSQTFQRLGRDGLHIYTPAPSAWLLFLAWSGPAKPCAQCGGYVRASESAAFELKREAGSSEHATPTVLELAVPCRAAEIKSDEVKVVLPWLRRPTKGCWCRESSGASELVAQGQILAWHWKLASYWVSPSFSLLTCKMWLVL